MTLIETIRNELARMLARQLDYAPAADELPFTIQVMSDDLHRRGLTDDDSDRVQEAFRVLGPQTQRWPTSRMVMECLPAKNSHRQLPTPKPDPQFVSTKLMTIKKSHVLRSVFRPNENYRAYMDAMRQSGLSQAAFEAKRLVENERSSDVAASDPDALAEQEAIAERRAIQEEA